MNRSYILVLAASLLGLVGPLPAQAPEGLAAKITEARIANSALMKKYSWQSRSELVDNGKVADTRIEMVTYGPDGQLQRTLLNDESSPLPRGFVRRRIAEREKEKVEKYLTGLRDLLRQYTLPTAGKALDFVNEAKIQAPDANGVLRLDASNVVSTGDTMSLWIHAATRQTQKIQIQTKFEGEYVMANASFRTLPSGLTHLEFAEVDVPSKEMKLQIHYFNYNQNN